MDNKESLLEKLRQTGSEVAQKQASLKDEFSKRPNYPQAGDIFVFAYSETMGLQWVILHSDDTKSHHWLLTVPADGVPMVGSNDVELSKNALCSPLTLRCKQGLWIRDKDFDINLRVGILEKWDLQRALDKEKQISTGNLRSTLSQQQMDDDLDYEEWMEQVIQGREVLIQSLQAIPLEEWVDFKTDSAKPIIVTDIVTGLYNKLVKSGRKPINEVTEIVTSFYNKLVTLLPANQMVPVTLTVGILLGFGINPLYTAFYVDNDTGKKSHGDQSNLTNVLDEETFELDETKVSVPKGQSHQDKSSENRLEDTESGELQIDETQAPLPKCQPSSVHDDLPQEVTEELAQLPPEEWLNKSLEKIMEGDISAAIEMLKQFQAKYPNYPE
jgi:hypothetical protein